MSLIGSIILLAVIVIPLMVLYTVRGMPLGVIAGVVLFGLLIMLHYI